MKSLLITPLVILALLAPLNAGADLALAKGVAAYRAGDYATALLYFQTEMWRLPSTLNNPRMPARCFTVQNLSKCLSTPILDNYLSG